MHRCAARACQYGWALVSTSSMISVGAWESSVCRVSGLNGGVAWLAVSKHLVKT